MPEKFKFSKDEPWELLNDPHFEQHNVESNLNALIHMFTNDVFRAYDQYNKNHDWMALADAIWRIYSNYIGFSRSTEQIGNNARLIKQFETDTKGHFLAALNGTFNDFYEIPKDHAVFALTRLLGSVKTDRNFEALCSPLTEDMKQKYDFLINSIEYELTNQENRPKDVSEHKPEQEEPGIRVIKNFQDFCLEKIKVMTDDDRERFLSINTGDRSFYDLGIKWKQEYNNTSGKNPIKDHKAPLGRAKKQYKELNKS